MQHRRSENTGQKLGDDESGTPEGQHGELQQRGRNVHRREHLRGPESHTEADETYKQIALRAGELGITIGLHTISRRVNAGRADIKECRNDTAYTRFAKHYCRLIGEHSSADADRHRELNRALATVERTCECGDEKM